MNVFVGGGMRLYRHVEAGSQSQVPSGALHLVFSLIKNYIYLFVYVQAHA